MAGLIDCKSEEDYDQLCDLLIGKYLVTGYRVAANCSSQQRAKGTSLGRVQKATCYQGWT
jgi:hypothetical protein